MEGTPTIDQVRSRLKRAAIFANAAGAIDVFLFIGFLLPVTASTGKSWIVLNLVTGSIYLVATFVSGSYIGRRWIEPLREWLESDRPPTVEERDRALKIPKLQGKLSALYWGASIPIFTLINLPGPASGDVAVALALLLGGITTAGVTYTLAERIMRPITARALAAGLPERSPTLPVGSRLVVTWILASGGPLLGIAAVAFTGLLDKHVDVTLLAAATLFVAVIGLGVGLFATKATAKWVSEPLADVRQALARVEEGDYDTGLAVTDSGEIGLVQVGLNRMAAGLREREQLQDLFGRHVGRDVARAALDGGVKLGGETREVGVLFVDLTGSTALASKLPPDEVVALLNSFFTIVVEVVEPHEGFVNKFEGDGALAVFGAPTPCKHPGGAALAAARELHARLVDELPQLDAGIGVSGGLVVAGNVGAEERFEYTVIGDPVNEAARLCELAKRRSERVLASEAVLRRADPDEADRWELRDSVVLRGRDQETRVAAPLRLRVAAG
jgi:adenylate cyclase